MKAHYRGQVYREEKLSWASSFYIILLLLWGGSLTVAGNACLLHATVTCFFTSSTGGQQPLRLVVFLRRFRGVVRTSHRKMPRGNSECHCVTWPSARAAPNCNFLCGLHARIGCASQSTRQRSIASHNQRTDHHYPSDNHGLQRIETCRRRGTHFCRCRCGS